MIDPDYFLFITYILLSAFFSGSETTLFSLSPVKLENLKSKSPRIGKIASRLLNEPQKLLVTILICNIFVNISATLTAIRIFPGWLAIPLVTVLIILFGEVIPKTLAISIAPKIVRVVSPIIYLLFIILTPLSFIFHRFARALVNFASIIFFSKYKDTKKVHSEEVIEAIRDSQKSGILDQEEGDILKNIIKFPDSDISLIARHRNEIFSISIDLKISDIIEFVKEKKFSRVPVWEDDEENIIGILYLKELLKINSTKRSLSYYRNILKKPLFIPDSVKAEQLLKNLQSTQNHIAIVIDEFGGISGIVTMEDVLEEIIGEVVDKDDVKPLYHRYNSKMIEVEAKMEIKELNAVFKTNIRSRDAVSVGGYILENIKRIPKVGEIFVFNNLQFRISGVQPNKIESVMITRMQKIVKKPKFFYMEV